MVEKIIGILGGMGSHATADLFLKILDNTPAQKDSEHLHIIIDCNPKVPSRRKALTEKGCDPTPALQDMAKRLEYAGADFLLIACNSAHAFIDGVQEVVNIPVVSIVEETVRATELLDTKITKVGLIAGSGPIKTKMFDKAFIQKGIEVLNTDDELQIKVLYVIDSVKAKIPTEQLKPIIIEVCNELIEKGAQAIIAGCTEIPIVLKNGDLSVPVLDATEYLAQAAVDYALCRRSLSVRPSEDHFQNDDNNS